MPHDFSPLDTDSQVGHAVAASVSPPAPRHLELMRVCWNEGRLGLGEGEGRRGGGEEGKTRGREEVEN